MSQEHIKGAPEERKGGTHIAAPGVTDESLKGGFGKAKGGSHETAGGLRDPPEDLQKSRDEVVDVADDDEL